MLARFLTLVGLMAAIVLLFFVTTTTPSAAGPLGILAVFVCLYVLLLVLISFLIVAVSRLSVRIMANFAVRRPPEPLPLLRAYYFSSVAALAPVMLLGMQSIGGVGLYEFALVLLFVFIASVYIAKRTS